MMVRCGSCEKLQINKAKENWIMLLLSVQTMRLYRSVLIKPKLLLTIRINCVLYVCMYVARSVSLSSSEYNSIEGGMISVEIRSDKTVPDGLLTLSLLQGQTTISGKHQPLKFH